VWVEVPLLKEVSNSGGYKWEVYCGGGTPSIIGGQGTNRALIQMPSNRGFGAVAVLVRVKTICAAASAPFSSPSQKNILESSSSYATAVSSDYQVYPNPADDFVTVAAGEEGTSLDKKFEIKITDKFSRVVRKEQAAQGKVRVSLKGMPDDTYYLYINDGTTVVTKQLVVRHYKH
jgi:hypothetical protein